ncbi:uncharacterized protein LOC142332320 isoform X2 [Lycorma delicatula]|uniref:uncharacterized protein LOC142332320 isoform X2 n=1 Tax=Lycorma delicatula TaxID=130591 RepID=UPI003F513091
MAEENILRKLLSGRINKSSAESNEEKIRKIVEETIASYQESASAAASSSSAYDVIQNLTKVMNFHVEHAVSEKSELAAEKAKRLEAEKEAEELRKKLEELKLLEKGNADKEKVERIEKQLNKLETEALLQKFIESLSLGNTKTDFLKNMKSESNTTEQNKKVYDDPDWFPGTSKGNEFLNTAAQKNILSKDPCSASAPVFNNLSQPNFPGNSGNTGGYSGNPFPKQLGPFPRPPTGPFPRQQGPFPGQQGPFSGQQGPFSGQQGPFSGHSVSFPGQPGQLPGQPVPQPLMSLSYNNAQYSNANQQFHGPFPSGPNGNSMPSPHQFPPQAIHNRLRGPGSQQRGFGNRPFRPNLNQGPDQLKFTKNAQKFKQKHFQKQQENNQSNQQQRNKQQPTEQTQKNKRSRNRNKCNIQNSEDGSTSTIDKQSRSTEAVNSVNFTATELKNVKHALNTKKSDCSDDDNDDDTANKDCSKNSETKESEGQTPRKQRNSQDVGGARKKDGSGIDSNKKKTNKNDNAGKQATTPGASNSKSGLSLFIGDKFPTLKDVETGKLSLTQNVKNMIMVAKLDDGKPVTEVPETVQDMILFNMNYPDARIVVTE